MAHVGDIEFKCNYHGCNAAYSSASSLRSHVHTKHNRPEAIRNRVLGGERHESADLEFDFIDDDDDNLGSSNPICDNFDDNLSDENYALYDDPGDDDPDNDDDPEGDDSGNDDREDDDFDVYFDGNIEDDMPNFVDDVPDNPQKEVLGKYLLYLRGKTRATYDDVLSILHNLQYVVNS